MGNRVSIEIPVQEERRTDRNPIERQPIGAAGQACPIPLAQTSFEWGSIRSSCPATGLDLKSVNYDLVRYMFRKYSI